MIKYTQYESYYFHHFLVYNSLVLSILTLVDPSISRTFFLIFHNWNAVAIKQSPPDPSNCFCTSLLRKLGKLQAPQMNGNMQFLSLCDFLISLSKMSSRFFRVIPWVWMPFCFKAEYCPVVCIYHTVFNHSATEGHGIAFTFWLLCIMLLWLKVCK